MSPKAKLLLRVAIGLIVFITVLLAVTQANDKPGLRVIFLDVGQGDAIYISAPDGFDIIIDGGPDSQAVNRLGGYMPFYDRTIELMILSHPHADHVTGLVELFERYKVERVLHSPAIYNNPAWEKLQDLFVLSDTEISIPLAGKQYIINDDLRLEIVHPNANTNFDDINEMSVVVRLVYGETTWLFTGDIGEIVEKQLIANDVSLTADVLKVGHHGSKYSSSQAFLEAIRPDYAIIQSGVDNSFDHPHEETLRRLHSQNMAILRNDTQGDIICQSDTVTVVCER